MRSSLIVPNLFEIISHILELGKRNEQEEMHQVLQSVMNEQTYIFKHKKNLL